MIKEIKDFKRTAIFDHYHQGNNPFIILTTKIDVTKVVNYCKEHKNFYSTIGYLITKTANEVDAFKYRYHNKKIYYCDNVHSSYTEIKNSDEIGFFRVEFNKDYKEYTQRYLNIKKDFLENLYVPETEGLDNIWLSCSPWFNFSSLIPPFNKEVTIPQFIWDKYQKDNEKYYVNLMIMVHHGFADGYHVGQFLEKLEQNIAEFK